MRILHLTVKKKWFDLIASGEKTQEYRELKEYWRKRLYKSLTVDLNDKPYHPYFDAVLFRNGYRKDSPKILVQLYHTTIGVSKPEWSENGVSERCYILVLGPILKSEDL